MNMSNIEDLKEQYLNLDEGLDFAGEEAIQPDRLLAFSYEYPEQNAEVIITTDEFTAGCPWTGLPDYGILTIRYVPARLCIELKSLKYYLLSYRSVGIVQEHAANRILKELAELVRPRRMELTLEYIIRAGVKTTVAVSYRDPANDK